MKRLKLSALTLVLSFLFSFSNTAKGQTLDSLSQTYINGNLSVYLNFFNFSGFDVSEVSYQKVNDTLTINVCVVNYLTSNLHSEDTTLQIAMPLTPNHYIVNLRNDINCSNLISSEYFTPNITIGIDERSSDIYNSIILYPNPTTGLINLHANTNLDISSIKLFDITGKKVKSYSALNKKLNTIGLSKGQYFLKIETKKGVITKKVQIE